MLLKDERENVLNWIVSAILSFIHFKRQFITLPIIRLFLCTNQEVDKTTINIGTLNEMPFKVAIHSMFKNQSLVEYRWNAKLYLYIGWQYHLLPEDFLENFSVKIVDKNTSVFNWFCCDFSFLLNNSICKLK